MQCGCKGSNAVKLGRIVAEFADLEPRERLELLLEFAENLPPLPDVIRPSAMPACTALSNARRRCSFGSKSSTAACKFSPMWRPSADRQRLRQHPGRRLQRPTPETVLGTPPDLL